MCIRDRVGSSWRLDYSIYCISDNNLLKGGLFITVLWGFWFAELPEKKRNRELVVSILLASMLAIAANKFIQVATPLRLRPYTAGLPGIEFPYPLGMREVSSFPSDHAMLFFVMVCGLFCLSRRIGFAALCYVVIVICLPRIYLGLHYPSDILGGAVVGVGCFWLVNGTRIRNWIVDFYTRTSTRFPALFYAGMFLLTYQIATLFDDARAVLKWLSVFS